MPDNTYSSACILQELNSLGIALSVERDSDRLMELILTKAMELTNADAGTLYIRTKQDKLRFQIVNTLSLKIHNGGTSGRPVQIPDIDLYDHNGLPNRNLVVASAVLDDKTINIRDAYDTSHYDFSGTRNFDSTFGYVSRSFLTVPMKNHENEIIGVLQVINKQGEARADPEMFNNQDIQLLESLASQAAVTLTKQTLIDDQRKLFDAFIQLIASAIDEKSPYTGAHCRRLPVLTTMLAAAACRTSTGPLKDFSMTEAEIYELEVAGWLHDCGKITTPVHVIDKATKLHTIYDRIETVETRLELLRKDAIIKTLMVRAGGDIDLQQLQEADPELKACCSQLEEYRAFLRICNTGSEAMMDEHVERLELLGNESWINSRGEQSPLLTPDEKFNLQIRKGTSNSDERQIINSHIDITIKMLKSLPYPKHLQRVPEYAGGHHEKMDVTGYPQGLTREQMSWPARMMGIADIFEALTACDRPYKKGMTLSQALTILGRMKQSNHIDPDLFDVFMQEQVYLEYAQQFLEPEQIDEVDLQAIPGFQPY